MSYKIGDKVRIKSTDWYNENKDKHGIVICGMMPFCGYMSCRCGTIVTISEILEWGYCIEEDYGENGWTDEMIEGLVEEEMIDLTSIVMETVEEKTIQNALAYGYNLPEGYIFKDENGNVINATKIVLEKKKKEYPKTFRECQECLGEDVPPMEEPDSKTHRRRQVHLLEVLLICRDAYWKIAGEEMGLDGPWEPNWEDKIYYIYYERHRQYGIGIKKAYCHCGIRGNRILVFPTAEMRDAFYESFKELIEICKELL